VLTNGIPLLTDPIESVRSVSFGVWIKTGSAFELPEQAGIAHFLEHLFFKGTSTRTARQLMEEIEGHGGHLNACTTRETVCLYARVLDNRLDQTVRLLADILRDSQFHDFEKERNVIIEEIVSIEDVPEDLVFDLLGMHLWPNHGLGRPISGFEDTVSRMAPGEVTDFYRRWCHGGNVVLSAAGRFDPDHLHALCEEAFGPVPPGAERALYEPPVAAAGVQSVAHPVSQSYVAFAFPSVPLRDPRWAVHEMLADALGGGSTSRLFDRIREQEGLAYTIHSFRSSYRLAGCTGVFATVAPENLGRTMRLCGEEFRKIIDDPLPEDELVLCREQWKGSFLMSLESTSARMLHMARSLINQGRLETPEELVADIDAVTPGQVLEAARATCTRNQCALVILGPEDGCQGELDIP
jgi:predicted Zn-dependent peptidase